MGWIKNIFGFILFFSLFSCETNTQNFEEEEFISNAQIGDVSVNLFSVETDGKNELFSFYYPTHFLMNGKATLYKFGYIVKGADDVNIFLQERCLGKYECLEEVCFLEFCIGKSDTGEVNKYYEIRSLENKDLECANSNLVMSKTYLNKTVLFANDSVQAIQSFYPSSVSSHSKINEGEQKIKIFIHFSNKKLVIKNVSNESFLLPYW